MKIPLEWTTQPPSPGTPEWEAAQKASARYYEAVGRFITFFATTENALFSLLGLLSKLPLPMAQAFFPGTRLSEAMSIIGRVLEARKMRQGASLEYEKELSGYFTVLFTHLAEINSVRNHILHHGTFEPDAAAPRVTNILRALGEERVKEFGVPVEDLNKLTNDLGSAAIMMALIGERLMSPWTELPPHIQASLDKPTWLYNSPLQGGKKGKNQKKTPKRRPRPGSSPK